MRILTGVGIFKEVEQDTFISTPHVGAYVSSSPLNAAVIYMQALALS